MTNRERFQRVMRFEKVDRLPVVEWAGWWDKTIIRWQSEGLPGYLRFDRPDEIRDYLGLDSFLQWWISPTLPERPYPEWHGAPLVRNEAEYEAFRKYLYPQEAFDAKVIEGWAKRQAAGETVVWITLEGAFWYPRTLFGIEPHLFAFYDYPDLMKRMLDDLTEFHLRALDEFCQICVPDFMTFGEDMSYNHGPMLSQAQFEELMAPYYRVMVPEIVKRRIVPIVDTDGDVTTAIPWFTGVGMKGFLPLERMAGIDVSEIRRNHPDLLMIGAYDKTVMHLGENRMRQEFERLLPVMKQGGFIPGVDHQTPPAVSYQDYQLYSKLQREYCELAMK